MICTGALDVELNLLYAAHLFHDIATRVKPIVTAAMSAVHRDAGCNLSRS